MNTQEVGWPAVCYGGHNHDNVVFANCYKCNRQIALLVSRKTGKRYPVQVVDYTTRYGNDRRNFVCWDIHKCSERDIELVAEEKARKEAIHEQALADGQIVKGQKVIVTSKRSRVARGIVGVVKWRGQNAYGGMQVGLAIEGVEKLTYLSESCVTAFTGDDADAFLAEWDAEIKIARDKAKAELKAERSL